MGDVVLVDKESYVMDAELSEWFYMVNFDSVAMRVYDEFYYDIRLNRRCSVVTKLHSLSISEREDFEGNVLIFYDV